MRRRDCGRIGSGYSGAECGARLQQLGGGEAIPLEGREENLFSKCRKSCVSIFVKSIKSLQPKLCENAGLVTGIFYGENSVYLSSSILTPALTMPSPLPRDFCTRTRPATDDHRRG